VYATTLQRTDGKHICFCTEEYRTFVYETLILGGYTPLTINLILI